MVEPVEHEEELKKAAAVHTGPEVKVEDEEKGPGPKVEGPKEEPKLEPKPEEPAEPTKEPKPKDEPQKEEDPFDKYLREKGLKVEIDPNPNHLWYSIEKEDDNVFFRYEATTPKPRRLSTRRFYEQPNAFITLKGERDKNIEIRCIYTHPIQRIARPGSINAGTVYEGGKKIACDPRFGEGLVGLVKLAAVNLRESIQEFRRERRVKNYSVLLGKAQDVADKAMIKLEVDKVYLEKFLRKGAPIPAEPRAGIPTLAKKLMDAYLAKK